MKKFIYNSIKFCIYCYLVFLLFDIIITNIILKSNNYAYGELTVWNSLLHSDINTNIIVNGNSRAWVQYNPKIIKQQTNKTCYNLGLDGNNFFLQKFRFDLYKKHNKFPKVLIQNVDSFTLAQNDTITNSEQFSAYILYNRNFLPILSKESKYDVFDFYIPLFRYLKKNNGLCDELTKVVLKDNPKKRDNGFQGQNKPWEGLNNYKKPTFFKQDNYLRNEFEKMILDCQKNKCKVILVYAPEYSASKHLIKNKKEIINYYNQVSKKYNIEFLDYSDGEISTNKLLFYNNSHLNTVGADIFTKQLTSDLNKIL